MASQVSKLNYVDGRLGAPTSGQQTTRILFHTIENPGTTTQLNFFESFQGLTPGQSNLTQNKLDSMESMVVKTLWFCQFSSTGISQWGANEPSVVDVIVGNQTVIKALPLAFNGGVGEAFDRIHNNSGLNLLGQAAGTAGQRVLPIEIRLLTDIVIPPQVTFKVVVRSASTNYGDGAVVCAIGGYGKIFSAGASF